MRLVSESGGIAFTGNPPWTLGGCSRDTLVDEIQPSVPMTIEHCLVNHTEASQPISLAYSSTQGWNYTVYTQTRVYGSKPVLLAGNQITLGPYMTHDDSLRILSVLTPTIAITDTMRETYTVKATSMLTPSISASAYALLLAPEYHLNERDRQVYIPLLSRRHDGG